MLEIVNYNKEEYNFPALVVLGCFDAVHVGHAELLKKAKLQAKINGLDLGVMMFAEGKGGRQVFTFEERLAFLAGYNTKFVLKIDYTDEFKKTTAADFLHNLEEHINVKAYMSGKDFRFGAGAKGKSSTLKNYAEDEENGVWYMPVKDVMVDGEKVSTTLIKKYIEEGKIQKANALLGRQYFVTGEVCEGHGRGKTLGFPTANIVYPANKVLVKDGVYGVEAEIDGAVYRGVANCGPRPTFGEDAVVLEAYFEGLSEELYGKPVTIKFVNYIRGIKKFDSAEALSEQISRDLACIGAPDADAEAEEAAPAVEAPAEVVAQTPAETAVETPAAEPVETVVETPAATEPETATEVPAETATAVPAEEPAVTEPEVAAETPVEIVTEEPVPAMEEVPAEAPVEAAEEPAAEPEVAPAEEPVAREPVAPIEEAPVEEVKAEEVQPEPEQPAEETTVGEVTESDVSDPEGEIAVAAEPDEEEAVTKLVEEVFEEEEPEQPSDAEQPEVPAEVAESEEEPAETVEEEPSTEPEAATEEQAAEPVTEEQAAEEVSEEIAVSEDAEEVPAEPAEEEPAETVEEQSEAPAEEVTESAEEPVEQPVCEPAEEPVEQPAEEPACEPAEEESEEPAEESAEEEADEAETSEEEQEQEADQPAEQTSRKSKKRKRSRGKADRRRGDTRKR